MNVFTFSGNLGADCRTNTVQQTAVCNFGVAVKSGFGDKEQTLWIDCEYWGKPAQGKLPEYLIKGAGVVVSGELGTRQHEGKTYLTCRVASLSLVGGKSEDRARPAAPQDGGTRQPPAGPDNFDEDIPF